jgi:putative nucleotidyltransferase with HDIG domain
MDTSAPVPTSLTERLFASAVGALDLAGVYLGDRLGLYAALSDGAATAAELAARAGIDEKSLFWFRIGALLHDVGKLVIPTEVLNKPGRLTEEEWALVVRHPAAGVEMLAEVDFPWDVRPMVRHHHERWDGGGYPDGLRGEDIPLAARILFVADAYDAMTTGRLYRAGLKHSQALDELDRCAGSQFDPLVVTALREELEQPTEIPLLLAETA